MPRRYASDEDIAAVLAELRDSHRLYAIERARTSQRHLSRFQLDTYRAGEFPLALGQLLGEVIVMICSRPDLRPRAGDDGIHFETRDENRNCVSGARVTVFQTRALSRRLSVPNTNFAPKA